MLLSVQDNRQGFGKLKAYPQVQIGLRVCWSGLQTDTCPVPGRRHTWLQFGWSEPSKACLTNLQLFVACRHDTHIAGSHMIEREQALRPLCSTQPCSFLFCAHRLQEQCLHFLCCLACEQRSESQRPTA